MSVANLNGRLQSNLRMVIVKDASKIWSQTEHPGFRDLFYKMIQMKLRGYEAEYPAGVLPIDTTDFIATHVLVCEEKKGNLIPLTGTKVTRLVDTLHHQISFPGLSLVHAAESKVHIEAMKRLIDRCIKNRTDLSYAGSWTTLPEARKNPSLNEQIIPLFQSAFINYHLDENIPEIITAGVLRFKVDRFCQKVGYEKMTDQDIELPPMSVKHVFGEEVQLLHLKNFSTLGLEIAMHYKEMWLNRIEFTLETLAQTQPGMLPALMQPSRKSAA